SEIPNDEVEHLLGICSVWITLPQYTKTSKLENAVDAALQVLACRHERIDVQRGQPGTLIQALLLPLLRPRPHRPQSHRDGNEPIHGRLLLSRQAALDVLFRTGNRPKRRRGSFETH